MSSNILRILIGIILAIIAGIGNFIWLTSQSKEKQPVNTQGYLCYADNYDKNEEIHTNVVHFIIPEDDTTTLSVFNTTFAPERYQKVIDGSKTSRKCKKGEMVLQADLSSQETPNVAPPEYSVLGPFRVNKIENQVAQVIVSYTKINHDGSYVFDTKVRRLFQIVSQNGRNTNVDLSILAVVTYPDLPDDIPSPDGKEPQDSTTASSTSLPLDGLSVSDSKSLQANNELLVHVPLNNVQNIPSEARYIGLVVSSSALTLEEQSTPYPIINNK